MSCKEIYRMKKHIITAVLAIGLALGFTGILAASADDWPEPYESYFLYYGQHPKEKEAGWHQDAQGITHDENYWFITQSDTDGEPEERSLWKIPVTHDLESVSPSDPGVTRISLDDVKPLCDLGYNHLGDLSYYEYKGEGYLVIPVEGGTIPALAVFRSSNLDYVGHDLLVGQTDAGWCAIDPDGYLYTSNSQATGYYKYSLRWDLLPNEVRLQQICPPLPFLDEFGNPLTLAYMQGGVFSESGHLLYVVSGFYNDRYPNDGISVFDTQTHRRVQQSTNGWGHFDYEFHPGWSKYEEPQGLTIWDLDDGRAPHIGGQLHVILLDNDELDPWWPDDDDVYLKHYTESIHVDGTYTGEEHGRAWDPFNTVGEANDFAWNGARICVNAGTYPESLMFSKQVQVLAEEGNVSLGTGGYILLTPSGAINLSAGGGLKIY